MKPLKLSGNFERGRQMMDAMERIESAQAELDSLTATDYGSEEYYEALKELKSAKSEHEKYSAQISD